MAGFIRPSDGEALLDGIPIGGPGADRGVVFQQYSLFPWMTVRKNVEFGLKMQGVGQHQRETAARSLLGMTGLLSFENHYQDQLSGGMKQRVGIVRTLATSPQMMLMDEPFGALDSQTRTVMQEILTNMWQQLQLSVLFITHDIEEAIFLSSKVYVLTARPGRIKAEIPIPLPRPRTPEMTASPTFQELVRQLKALIREESRDGWRTRHRWPARDGSPFRPRWHGGIEMNTLGIRDPHRFPKAIVCHDASRVLELRWHDGSASSLPHGLLRAHCRCAGCQQDYRQHGRHPDINPTVAISAIHPLSDKGLNLVFSDGHGRGIFPWAYLRELSLLAPSSIYQP